MKSNIHSRVKMYFIKKGIKKPEDRLRHLQVLMERGWSYRIANLSYDEVSVAADALEQEIVENILLQADK